MEKRGNKCDVCNKGFKLIHECVKHFFNDHMERSFTCNLCLEQFVTFICLKQHVCEELRPCERCKRRCCECCPDEYDIPYPEELLPEEYR